MIIYFALFFLELSTPFPKSKETLSAYLDIKRLPAISLATLWQDTGTRVALGQKAAI